MITCFNFNGALTKIKMKLTRRYCVPISWTIVYLGIVFSIRQFSCTWWRHQMETFSALRGIQRPPVRGIQRSPVNSSHKGQWRGALMFSLISAWINRWVNSNELYKKFTPIHKSNHILGRLEWITSDTLCEKLLLIPYWINEIIYTKQDKISDYFIVCCIHDHVEMTVVAHWWNKHR